MENWIPVSATRMTGEGTGIAREEF
ncbi:hypothetical protein LBW99_05855 [Wolbachia endosymbiont of Nasonia oneida]|nr:hypothetical protein DEF52_04940 [Wolbachia endosymbiont of Nasonia oneida]MBA8767002.1 hypothetical protein [Wolbachia pipientis]